VRSVTSSTLQHEAAQIIEYTGNSACGYNGLQCGMVASFVVSGLMFFGSSIANHRQSTFKVTRVIESQLRPLDELKTWTTSAVQTRYGTAIRRCSDPDHVHLSFDNSESRSDFCSISYCLISRSCSTEPWASETSYSHQSLPSSASTTNPLPHTLPSTAIMSTLEDLDDMERERKDEKKDSEDGGKDPNKPSQDGDAEMKDADSSKKEEEKEEDILDAEILHSSTRDIQMRKKLMDNDLRIMKSEFQRLTHEQAAMKEKIKDNLDKIENNRWARPLYASGSNY